MNACRDIVFDTLKNLQPDAAKNLSEFISCENLPDRAAASVCELVEAKKFGELDDRFFRHLSFGTGGLRGRVLAANPARAEIPAEEPEYPAVGTNCLNDFTVLKAALGLWDFCADYCAKNGGAPRLVIARDVRFFSERFCALTASLWRKKGGEVFIFSGARSTPQLSFTVRKLKALAGVVITASHNPPHDNGYKVYFKDGGQITNKIASEIAERMSKIGWGEVCKHLQIDLGGVKIVPQDVEECYIKSIADCVLDKPLIEKNPPKIVFSPVHGTGAFACPKVMGSLGISPILVEAQMAENPRFPTVKTPNPEYPETLSAGIEIAKRENADAVLVTDPDADRLGVAVRGEGGEYGLLDGNSIAAALFYYRAEKMRQMGIIKNPKNCAVIKTFVTTPLIDKIARARGLKCVNVLTGFKWIGERLTHYENLLEKEIGAEAAEKLGYLERAALMQKHSTFAVFGGEESYGYIAADSVRDKDANAALAMFCELMACLKSRGKSFADYMAEIYSEFGCHAQAHASVYFEGAGGARKIQNILESLEENPLESLCGCAVSSFTNFSKEGIFDADGLPVPAEKFYFYELENGAQFAVRASGTEPKIKFYIFASAPVSGGVSQKDAMQKSEEIVGKIKGVLVALARQRCG
ncbi:MAG: phospho-sugar mutase [Opitutales bacterium]|nr:phospho-sugar mutase [Opitutales bacterium]